jgi:hypothetical protein
MNVGRLIVETVLSEGNVILCGFLRLLDHAKRSQ